MMRFVTQTKAIVLFLFTVGLSSGCSGGPVSTVGRGILSTKELPAEIISIDALPANVRKFVEKETANGIVKEVTRGVRTSDGKYFYTNTHADPAEVLTAIRCWHDGTLISSELSQ